MLSAVGFRQWISLDVLQSHIPLCPENFVSPNRCSPAVVVVQVILTGVALHQVVLKASGLGRTQNLGRKGFIGKP